MKKNKIGIATLYTGYNYGSSLQAYAVKEIVDRLNYEPVIFHQKGSIIKNRDVRLKKLIRIIVKVIMHPKYFLTTIKRYKKVIKNDIPFEMKKSFESFSSDFLSPLDVNWNMLKKYSQAEEYTKFLCGSDQIWDADTLYVDPFYYLKFAPKSKRVAFAPSFGKEKIMKYNQKTIKKYLSDIRFLSVREESGERIIKQLTGRDSIVLVDPTLVLNANDWKKIINTDNNYNDYALVYFLDEISNENKNFIIRKCEDLNLNIISISFSIDSFSEFLTERTIGPLEFLNIIYNAKIIFTDSFHGTAFSLNFNKDFFTFERNYVGTEKQSSRITSILEKTNTLYRYCPKEGEFSDIDYSYVNSVLDSERRKSIRYLRGALYEK